MERYTHSTGCKSGFLHKNASKKDTEEEMRLIHIEGKVPSRLNQQGGGEWYVEPEKPNYPARIRTITERSHRVSRDTEEKGHPREWG